VTVVRDGDFVGVAAPNEQIAEQALAAIKAEWKSTAKDSSKTLFEDLKKNRGAGGGGFGGRDIIPAAGGKKERSDGGNVP